MRDGISKDGQGKPRNPEDKSARLAAALRANLTRRKAQQRARAVERKPRKEQG